MANTNYQGYQFSTTQDLQIRGGANSQYLIADNQSNLAWSANTNVASLPVWTDSGNTANIPVGTMIVARNDRALTYTNPGDSLTLSNTLGTWQTVPIIPGAYQQIGYSPDTNSFFAIGNPGNNIGSASRSWDGGRTWVKFNIQANSTVNRWNQVIWSQGQFWISSNTYFTTFRYSDDYATYSKAKAVAPDPGLTSYLGNVTGAAVSYNFGFCYTDFMLTGPINISSNNFAWSSGPEYRIGQFAWGNSYFYTTPYYYTAYNSTGSWLNLTIGYTPRTGALGDGAVLVLGNVNPNVYTSNIAYTSAKSPEPNTMTPIYMPSNQNWWLAAQGGGKFVAVANSRALSAAAFSQDIKQAQPGDRPFDVGGAGLPDIVTTNNLTSIAYNGSVYVLTGINGLIIYSYDYETFNIATSPTRQTTNDILWTGSQFILVGNGGVILTSPNGVNWTARNSGTQQNLYSIEYKSGIYTAAGQNGIILYSTNTITWSNQQITKFVIPDNTNNMQLWVIGAGGGGAGSPDDLRISWSGGGGAGGMAVKSFTSASSGQQNFNGNVITFYQGLSGVPSANSRVNGGDGGTTTVIFNNTTITANGGIGGKFYTAGVNLSAPGGTSTGGDYNLPGGWGSSPTVAGYAGGGGGGINLGNAEVSTGFQAVGLAGGQAQDAYGLFANLTIAGLPTTGPGTGGSGPTANVGNGNTATGFGSGGGGAYQLFGFNGGNGYWGGGGGGATQNLFGNTFSRGGYGGSGVVFGYFSNTITQTSVSSIINATSGALEGQATDGVRTVAVSSDGSIAYSFDGVTWQTVPPVTYTTLNSVVYTGVNFVAVGELGTIVTSTDANTWTVQNTGTTDSMYSVTYSPALNLVVAVNSNTSSNSSVYTSFDYGVTWTPRYNDFYLSFVNWDGARFIAVGLNGTVVYSYDGIIWTSANVLWSSLLYAQGSYWLAASTGNSVYRSLDGLNWGRAGRAPFTGGIAAMGYNSREGKLLAISNQVSYSYNNNLNAITYSPARKLFCVVGAPSTYYNKPYLSTNTSTTPAWIMTSPDGLVWTWQNSGVAGTLNDIIWTGTQFVAVGTNSIVITSPDGVVWTRRTGPTNQASAALPLQSIAYNGVDTYVVVSSYTGQNGNSTEGSTRHNAIFSSQNLSTWNGGGQIGTMPVIAGGSLYDSHQVVVYGNGNFYIGTGSFTNLNITDTYGRIAKVNGNVAVRQQVATATYANGIIEVATTANLEINQSVVFGSQFLGYANTNSLAVTEVYTGTIGVGQALSGSGIRANSWITGLQTGVGGIGNYTIVPNQSATFTAIGNATSMTVYTVTDQVLTVGATVMPWNLTITAAQNPYTMVIAGITSTPSVWIVTLSTPAPATIPDGATVTIAGTTPSAYNGTWQVLLGVSPIQFIVANNSNPGAAITPGNLTGLNTPITGPYPGNGIGFYTLSGSVPAASGNILTNAYCYAGLSTRNTPAQGGLNNTSYYYISDIVNATQIRVASNWYTPTPLVLSNSTSNMTMSLGVTTKFYTPVNGGGFPFYGLTYSSALNSWYGVCSNTGSPTFNTRTSPTGNYQSRFVTPVWSSQQGGLNLIVNSSTGNGTLLGDNTIQISSNNQISLSSLFVGKPIQFTASFSNIATQTTYYVKNIFLANNSITVSNTANLQTSVILANTTTRSQIIDWIPGASLGSYNNQLAPSGSFNRVHAFGNVVVAVGGWGNIRTIGSNTSTRVGNSYLTTITVTGCDAASDLLYANNTGAAGAINIRTPITFYNAINAIQANTIYYVSNIASNTAFSVSATATGSNVNITATLSGLSVLGSTWNVVDSNINAELNDVAYDGNSTYVTCGIGGYLQYATNPYAFSDPKIANGAALVDLPTTLEIYNSSSNMSVPQVSSGTFRSLGVLPTGLGDMLWVKTSN